jgi:hypothetical protein
MKMNHYQTGMMLLTCTLLLSCGGGSSNSLRSSPQQQQEEEVSDQSTKDGSNINGTYLGKFRTINSHVVGTIPGSSQLKREGNKLSAFVRFFAGSPSIAHFQNVHTGTRCPSRNDDKNGDGYIDVIEAHAVLGKIIIPLDWDIGSQASGNRSWPKAFPNGSYEYTKTTNFDRFWKDLKTEDRVTPDNITKLKPDQGLNLIGKAVLILGVAEDKNLPESVASYGRWKNHQTLPIACAVLKPHGGNPGTLYVDATPGPVADVSPDQDRPAPDGSLEEPGTGTVIIPGPSNDAGSNDSGPEDDDTPDDGDNRRPPGPVPVPVPTPEPDDEWEEFPPIPTPEPFPYPYPEPEDDENENDGTGWCLPWENDCKK